MKSKKLFYWLLPVLVYFILPANHVYSQKWMGSLTYQISVPMGDTKDFTGKTSFRGIGLDFRYTVQKSTTVGFILGWNVFNERSYETTEIATDNPGTITGTQDSYLNSYPIMINAHYHFGNKGQVRPYLGLNAGGFIMTQRLGIGIHAFENTRWEWGVAPEAGILIPINYDSGFLVSGKYNYAFTGESAVGTDINNSYVSLSVGFYWYP